MEALEDIIFIYFGIDQTKIKIFNAFKEWLFIKIKIQR